MFGGTGRTLDEQEVASNIEAVGVIVAGFAALMAGSDYIFRDAFGPTFIEDEVLTNELVRKLAFPHLPHVFNDSTIELVHVLVSLVFEPGACFFAADATGTVHDNVFVFIAVKHVCNHLNFFAEGIDIGRDGANKVAHFGFVVVPHIDEDGIWIFGQGIEFFCGEVFALVGDIEGAVVEAVSNNFLTHLDDELEEGLSVVIDRDIESDSIEEGDAVELVSKAIEVGFWQADLGIDAFMCDVGAAENT